MRLHPECIPCMLKARVKEIDRFVADRKKGLEIISSIMKEVLPYIVSDEIGPKVGTISFRLLRKLIGVDDPYFEYKKASNDFALAIVNLIKDKLSELNGYEKFRTLAYLAIMGNSVDPGAADYKFSIEEWRKYVTNVNIDLDDTLKLYKRLKSSSIGRIAYLCDNAGEIVFDKLLIEFLIDNGVEVVAVVRGAPFQNDALMFDAEYIGLTKVTKVISTGSDSVGFIIDWLPEEVVNEVLSSDLIISKGLGNYETLNYYRDIGRIGKPIFYLLVAKCKPVAKSIGCKVGDYVAWLCE
ncbi:MAG: hypothetical protein DRJ32_02130 [Thermoprotei archaeon]|nr:MAG: hypothetical protein DRJ32_02130 [Thermoprotei archaeon]